MRDNIILEFGLFAGAPGLERTYLLTTGEVSLPSDVLGLTQLRYRPRADHNIAAGLNGVLLTLQKQVTTHGSRTRGAAHPRSE